MAVAECFRARALVDGFRSARFLIIIIAARGMTKEYSVYYYFILLTTTITNTTVHTHTHTFLSI
jgi:hypothetical protein